MMCTEFYAQLLRGTWGKLVLEQRPSGRNRGTYLRKRNRVKLERRDQTREARLQCYTQEVELIP